MILTTLILKCFFLISPSKSPLVIPIDKFKLNSKSKAKNKAKAKPKS